jgi:glucose-1-phosphate thymidylyltransferase
VVGADCEVGPGAVVGPTTALGHNVTVGSNATIERCVLDADTRVGAGSVLLDCVTGQDVDLGPATVGSGGPADVRIGSSVFENRRLGAVVADRVHAVGDTGLAPGTLVGPNATLHHGARASGRIAAGAEVVR